MNGTKSAHVKQTTNFGIAHLGDSGMPIDRATTDMSLGVKTDEGCQSLSRASAIGERLPTIEEHHQRQDDLGADARDSQQARLGLVQVGMLVQMSGDGFLDLAQRRLQCFEDLPQIVENWGRNAWASLQLLPAILFLLHHLLQVATTLDQTVEFTDLAGQGSLWLRLTSCAIASQHARILAVCFGALASAFGPIAYLSR